jgi:hypothetical protein
VKVMTLFVGVAGRDGFRYGRSGGVSWTGSGSGSCSISPTTAWYMKSEAKKMVKGEHS